MNPPHFLPPYQGYWYLLERPLLYSGIYGLKPFCVFIFMFNILFRVNKSVKNNASEMSSSFLFIR